MKGYYINLDKDTEKRKKMESSLKSLNLQIERFPAVYGKEIDKDKIRDIFSDDYLKSISDGAIGCALSHISLWTKIINENLQNTIILEDDIVFTDDSARKLEILYNDLPLEYDIIYLGCTGICGQSCKNITGDLICSVYNDLLHIPTFPVSTHGYIISITGAKKILGNVFPTAIDFDIKLSHLISNKKINAYSMITPIVNQVKDSSDIIVIRKKLLGKFFPFINQPIFKLPFSYPLNFYIDIYSFIVIITSIIVAYNYRQHSKLFFSILFIFNWIYIILGYSSMSDRRIAYHSLFDTFVPLIIFFVITKTLCSERNKKCLK